MKPIEIKAPYILFLGDEERPTYTKTAQGILDWQPEKCLAQLRLTEQTFDLGLPDLDITRAREAGVRSLLIGTAQIGGSIPGNWLPVLIQAAEAGIDVVAGLHVRLKSVPELVAAAERGNANLIDIRVPPDNLPVGDGKKRAGKRLITVGTDCALGKKYTALRLSKDMSQAGLDVDFRASGQTGIMIAGTGIAIDAVVTDFISGAAEVLSPANNPDHWDVVEGQGAIFHPGYAAVTHGLLIGSQPDAFVVCHEAHRQHISGWAHYPLPSIGQVIERTIAIGSLTNPGIQCVGISINSAKLAANERSDYLDSIASKYQLPCVDPMIDGTGSIVAELTRRIN